MDGNIVGQLLLQVALIMLNAVFACAEIAVLSFNGAKLEKLSADALADVCTGGNPREVSQAEILALYRKVY